MADIRIKDLTTLESASLTGDVFVIDGTTGTRKLSAFSPTFGGNATVTGTLTVNGTGTNSIPNLSVTGIGGLNVSANFLTSANTLRFSDSAAGGQTWFMSPQLGDGVATNFAFYSNDGVTSTPLFRVSSAGVFRLPSTTASTTTSTGALVVGNGTSGGLGVGGSINLGANLVSTASDGKIQVNGTGNTTLNKELTFQRSDAADSFAIGLTGSAYAGAFTGLGNNEAYLYNSSASAFRIFLGTAATNRFDFTSSQFKINATTASTSTSSGALVVSGGVGVGGALNCGGLFDFAVSANSTQVYTIQNTSTGVSAATRLTFVGGTSSGNIQLYGSGHSTPNILQYASPSSHAWQCNGVERATLSSAGALTVSSSLTTGAPSGGTAAAWKLGTVATVSPTSPNRTIEVDIGGTIYYLAAKTTNN